QLLPAADQRFTYRGHVGCYQRDATRRRNRRHLITGIRDYGAHVSGRGARARGTAAQRQDLESCAIPLCGSALAEGFGEAGVVELVVALDLPVGQLPDVDPRARRCLAGLANAEADVTHGDDGVAL